MAENAVTEISVDVTLEQEGSAYVVQTWTGSFDEGTACYFPVQNLGKMTRSGLTVSDGQGAFANDLAREMAKVNTICNLIVSQTAGAASATQAAPASADRTGDDSKKFKELLDSGVITQAEFDAKNKQLLGI